MQNDFIAISNLSDEELIRYVQNRSELAFAELMSRWTPRIRAIIFANSRQRRDAEEIHTDTWVTVWQNIRELREIERFGAWLRRIAYNACKRYYRTARQSRNLVPDHHPELVEYIDHQATARFKKEQLIADAKEAIHHLPKKVRSVAELFYLESWHIKEIAEEFNLPIGTVKTRLSETRALLREEFDVEPKRGGFMSSQIIQSQNQIDKKTDEKIIAAAVNGDCASIELIKEIVKPWISNDIQKYYKKFYGVVNVQEMNTLELLTLKKVINKLNAFIFVIPFREWVRRLTYYSVFDHYRDQWLKWRHSIKEKSN